MYGTIVSYGLLVMFIVCLANLVLSVVGHFRAVSKNKTFEATALSKYLAKIVRRYYKEVFIDEDLISHSIFLTLGFFVAACAAILVWPLTILGLAGVGYYEWNDRHKKTTR